MQPFLPAIGGYQTVLGSTFRRKRGNALVRVQMNPPRTSSVGGLEIPVRLVKTGPHTDLIPGDTIIGSNSRRYLLIGQGKEERNGEGFAAFKSVELDRITAVIRSEKLYDAATKRTNEVFVAVALMDFAEVPLRQEEDSLKVQNNRYEILTDFPLQAGDRIYSGKLRTIPNSNKVNYNQAASGIINDYTALGGYGESGYGEYGYNGFEIKFAQYGAVTRIVQEVENRFGAYWARVRNV